MFKKIVVSLVLVMLLVPAGSEAGSVAKEPCGPPIEGGVYCADHFGGTCDNYVTGEIQALVIKSPPFSQSAEFCYFWISYQEKTAPVYFRFDVLEPWNHPDKQAMCESPFPDHPDWEYCLRYVSRDKVEYWRTSPDMPDIDEARGVVAQINAPVQYLPLVEH